MPHLPVEDERWMQILKEDVEAMGIENAKGVQDASFDFTFSVTASSEERFPPTLVLVGDRDVAMARRDFEQLVKNLKKGNKSSRGLVLKDAWHNHSVDIPERFADIVDDWARKMM